MRLTRISILHTSSFIPHHSSLLSYFSKKIGSAAAMHSAYLREHIEVIVFD